MRAAGVRTRGPFVTSPVWNFQDRDDVLQETAVAVMESFGRYDPATGVIHRMVFVGLPKARGGPDSVAVELLERRELGGDFVRHQAHHAADRRAIEED